MVAINFMKQFANDVEDGIKTRTVRQKARCKRGDKLQLYTGMRTKGCRKLMDTICTGVDEIEIHGTEMFLNGKRVLAGNAERGEYEDRDNDFAKKDGFDGFMEMAEFFEKQYGLPFKGFVISWSAP